MNVALKEHFSKNTYKHAVTEEIENHQAWHGHMSGLVAEKLLRGCLLYTSPSPRD